MPDTTHHGEEGPVDPDAVARLLRTRLADDPLELPVAGSSMAGVISTGSRVRVVSASRPRAGEIWAYVSDDGGIVVHRIREHGATTVTARGTGNTHDDLPVPAEWLVGRVDRSIDPSGRVHVYGDRDRVMAAISFRIRRLARAFRPNR